MVLSRTSQPFFFRHYLDDNDDAHGDPMPVRMSGTFSCGCQVPVKRGWLARSCPSTQHPEAASRDVSRRLAKVTTHNEDY